MVIEGMHYDPDCGCKNCVRVSKSNNYLSSVPKSLPKIIKEMEEKFEKQFAGAYGYVNPHWSKLIKSFITGQIKLAVESALEAVRLEEKMEKGYMPLEDEALIKNVRANLEHNEEESKLIGYNQAKKDLDQRINNFLGGEGEK